MTREQLQKGILELLKTSTVPAHYKRMLETLVPVMDTTTLQATYDPLILERKKLHQLEDKKLRIEHKYRVMIEKLCELELRKK